jgi:hypothetical protein
MIASRLVVPSCLSHWRCALLILVLVLLQCFSASVHAQGSRASAVAPTAALAPAPAPAAYAPPPGGDDPFNQAGFSSQSVPTTMTAGAVYTVTVRMFNSGTTTWSSSTSHALGAQNPQDNGTWGGSRVGMAGNVAPGQTATFTFQVTAPWSPRESGSVPTFQHVLGN